MLDLFKMLQAGGINIGLIVGIIGLLFALKRLDIKHFFRSGFYLIAVVVLGLLAGFIVAKGNFIISGISHAGIASLLYQYISKISPAINKKSLREGDKFLLWKK